MPRWLAWSALLLAVLTLVPGQFGFLASLAFYAWVAAAGVSLLFTRQVRSTTSYTAIQKEVRHA